MSAICRGLFSLVCSAAIVAAAPALGAEVKIDSYTVAGPAPAPAAKVLVRTFDASRAELGGQKKDRQQESARNMQATAPIAFREALVQRLAESKTFSDVRAVDEATAPADALVIEGRFTVLNPGNRSKRYLVGFGAGKSKVCVEGRVLSPAREELASFRDCRSGTGMVGFVGGRAEGMMTNDVYAAAFNVADFLALWGKGAIPAASKAS